MRLEDVIFGQLSDIREMENRRHSSSDEDYSSMSIVKVIQILYINIRIHSNSDSST